MKLKTIALVLLFVLGSKLQAQELNTVTLRDTIQQLLVEKEIPGAFITIVSKDSILFQETFGTANIMANTPVNKRHLFRIASITKTFTAMAIMKLVEEGKLSLEDELRKIAPEISFLNEWEDTHPVRIKHLLEHKAGFEDLHFSHLVLKSQSEFAATTLEGIALYEKSLKCAWKPGLVTSYSNPGYLILAHLIEKVSGMAHQAYITTAILEPLHLQSTRFAKTLRETDLVANGYINIENEIRPAEIRDYKIVETASGLLSNAADMGRFLQFFLNENLQDSLKVISKKSVLEMETLHGDFELANNIQTGYSLGIEDRVFGDGDLLFKGNSGLTDGFTSNFIYSRKHNLGIATSTNLFGVGHRDMIDVLVNTFATTKGQEPRSFKAEKFNSEIFEDWEGEHRELNDTQEIFNFINFPIRTKTITFENNRLLISDIENGMESYVYVGGNAFMDISNAETFPSVYLTEFEGDKSLYYYDSTYVSTNSIAYSILRFFLILSLVTPILATIYLLVLAIRLLPKKSKKKWVLKLFLLTLPFWILVVSVALTLSHLSYDKIATIGNFNSISIIIFVCSLLFPILCFFGVYVFLRDRPTIKQRFIRLSFGVLVFGNCFLSLYCIYMGWFAVQFWT